MPQYGRKIIEDNYLGIRQHREATVLFCSYFLLKIEHTVIICTYCMEESEAEVQYETRITPCILLLKYSALYVLYEKLYNNNFPALHVF